MKKFIAPALALTFLVCGAPTDAVAQGSITGKITFAGTPPASRKVLITKDNAVCGNGSREIKEVDVKGGLLRNVVVYVAGKLAGDTPPAPPAGGYKLEQKGCAFQPYIMYMPKNAELNVINSDGVAHNIHAYEIIGRARRDVFNFSQPTKGHVRKQKVKPRRGKAVQLTCDIHDFMTGWIFVPPNSKATVSKDGTFTLSGVPAGNYTVKVFHPTLGEKSAQVAVSASGAVTANFAY